MKTVTSALQTAVQAVGLTLTRCWRITPQDFTDTTFVKRYTRHTRDLKVGAETFSSLAGVQDTSIDQNENMTSGGLDATVFLSQIDESALQAGRYDHARVEIFDVDYLNTGNGTIPQSVGFLGDVRKQDGLLQAEIRGPAMLLANPIGDIYTVECRARLGDGLCTVEMADLVIAAEWTVTGTDTYTINAAVDLSDLGYTVNSYVTIAGSTSNDGTYQIETVLNDTMVLSGIHVNETSDATITMHRNRTFTGTIATVTAGDERRTFTTSALTFPGAGGSPADGYFREGNFTMTSGNNSGVRRDIRTHDGVAFTTYLEFPFDLVVGDAFALQQGCDKSSTTCKDTFDNLVNYRGFPFIPALKDVFGSPVSAT